MVGSIGYRHVSKLTVPLISAAHFRGALRLFVGDAGPPTLGLPREADAAYPALVFARRLYPTAPADRGIFRFVFP